MTEEQEIALQRINDPAYFNYSGSESDIALLHSLMENVAKSEWGAKIISGLKRNEDLPESHQLTIKIQDAQQIGLPPSGAVHCDNGDIVLFKRDKDANDEKVFQGWVRSLAHELCHEEQFQQGLHEYSNFTPEQNFIINRLQELDALNHGLTGKDNATKQGFEGTGGAGHYATIYNHQALIASFGAIHEGKVSDKSFEEIRDTYVKRLGVNIDPEYFSAQTIANSYCGKFFLPDGKMPIQHETHNMNDGKLSTFKHPERELRIYTPKDGGIGIREQTFKTGHKTLCFFDQKSSETLLAIDQYGGEIQKVQTRNNPSECRDSKDFEQTVSQMHLSKDVSDAFNFDASKVKGFIDSPQKKENFGGLRCFLSQQSKEGAGLQSHSEQKQSTAPSPVMTLKGMSR
ncbi:MAG: hypothetical protein E7021_02465 [Alphaproteobacteria bacterium]|nr:hypothetical protein [Alphaproteobacteria bacterium]